MAASLNTLIGFDFGMRYIGVAVGQTISMTTQACHSLSAQDGIPSWPKVESLLKLWHPDALVVGVPIHLDGKVHLLTLAAQQFIQSLLDRFPLPVYAAEERLTTVEARSRLFAQGGYRSLSKNAIDGLSAQLILEGWLSEYYLSNGI